MAFGRAAELWPRSIIEFTQGSKLIDEQLSR